MSLFLKEDGEVQGRVEIPAGRHTIKIRPKRNEDGSLYIHKKSDPVFPCIVLKLEAMDVEDPMTGGPATKEIFLSSSPKAISMAMLHPAGTGFTVSVPGHEGKPIAFDDPPYWEKGEAEFKKILEKARVFADKLDKADKDDDDKITDWNGQNADELAFTNQVMTYFADFADWLDQQYEEDKTWETIFKAGKKYKGQATVELKSYVKD